MPLPLAVLAAVYAALGVGGVFGLFGLLAKHTRTFAVASPTAGY